MDKAKIDALVAKLTSRDYQDDADALAKDFTDGMAGIARQPGIDRGLKDNAISDVQGGTSLGVGDPAAGHVSDYLVQNPQPGVASNVGSGLQTRRQTRIETETKTLPGVVVTEAIAGDLTVRVRVTGDGATKTTDPATGIEVVSPMTVGDGTEYDASMTGMPIVAAGEDGIQPIEAGRTVSVVLAKQWEVTTTHTKRHRKNLPVVQRVLKSSTACLVNGFACKGNICIPSEVDQRTFNQSGGNTSDWDFQADGNAGGHLPGKPYMVLELNSDIPAGTLDRVLGNYTPYEYGVVPPDGIIPFLGITYADATAGGKYYYYDGLPDTPFYTWFVMLGCATGQYVNFGPVELNRNTTNIQYELIDSNFPIPL